MLKAALSKIESEFSPDVIANGQQYYSRGHVLSIRLSDGLLRARVKGSSGQIYNIHIDLKSWPGNAGRCDCKDKVKCKHAVACFFALQDKEKLSIIKPTFIHKMDSLKEEESIVLPSDEVIHADSLSWYSDFTEQGNDFFAYQLGILIDEKPISIVPLVVNLLQRLDRRDLEAMEDDKLVNLPLEKNKWLRIEFGRIKPLLRILLSYGLSESKSDNSLEMKEYQLALMQEAEQAILAVRARWQGTENVRDKLSKLANKELPEVEIPTGLKTSLRDYQHQGLNWLQFLKNNGFAGILADDMGLGKTIQALANLQLEKQAGNMQRASLIVAPTSLVGNWYAEAKKFTPELRVLVFHGFDRHEVEFDDYDLIISTYGLMQRDKVRFLAYDFYYLILDEAQFIKNARTKTTKIMQQLKADYRLCLTGTPLENHLGELWSLFHFLMPGLLGDSKQFRQFFRVPIEKDSDLARKEILNGRIKPFMLRRTKSEVMQELPLKTEITRLIDIVGPQRDLYEAIRLTMEEKVRSVIAAQGIGKSQILVLDALLKLRQVCCDPNLLSLPEAEMAAESSAKLDALMELLDNLMEEGRSVLVFSQFTSMLKIIEGKLAKKNYPYFKLTGETKNRQDLVDKFQDGEAPIFLISLKAGGTGLNLTRADTVILYDPWWNPAVQEQAAGRSHRIGQENPVFIYKLIMKGSVEEVILDIQAKKRDLFDSVLKNQMQIKSGLSEEDIDKFFAPLKIQEESV
ncbi:MAG: DEAD/DEAH box helicase [Legionellaceae bacterium]|nr:DEAD/DEAH box helicase [Legionellaceae bacterium]